MDTIGFVVNDKRGKKQEEKELERCRVCGSPEVHSREYNKPTMACINHLRKENQELVDLLDSAIT